MASLAGFNADEHQDEDFGVIPADRYVAVATASAMKPTKDGQGQYLEFTFEVIDGPYKGRKVWSRMNLINKNQTAVSIANRELANLCRAIGIIKPNDSSELHNKPIFVNVEVVPGQKREQNEIKSFESINAQAPAAAPAPAPFAAPPAQAPAPSPFAAPPAHVPAAAPAQGGSTPPWR